ncbi:MAG: NADPH-dependent FMN reductase [Aureispira sp.]
MLIHTISGSSRTLSSNRRLLEALNTIQPQHQFVHLEVIQELPLFQANLDIHPWPPAVLAWRAAIAEADAVVICTPEYLHNMPALLKNGLEWLSSSGELVDKSVLPITFTPHAPRGEKTMQSLIWTLQALNAKIVTQLPLYQQEVTFEPSGAIAEGLSLDMLQMAIDLL